MNNKIWRFPGNNYTQDQGLNTGDMETFASKPISSLAREICQNSVDARLDGMKSIVEFSLFDIEKEKIPGIERLEEEIDSCIEYRENQAKLHQELKDMKLNLNNKFIHCLRISDFNTKGLLGVTNNENSPFHLLTKGSGISDKSGAKGGSKGIGKYAAFVASNINTVFYSTLNIDNENAYIGISKLCSTRMKGTDERTIGIGYYGSDEKNSPILEQVNLDNNFKRKTSGTDVYIIGFRGNDSWKKELITQILDSFISAIYFELLEVKVGDLIINKDSLSNIVYDDNLIIKSNQNYIRAQFSLLNDETTIKKEIEIEDYGIVKMYLKGYTKLESDKATNDCVMIRYPYMKIKTLTKISTIPCAAMCIIEDNQLNKMLREIENPQHTGWFPDRIDDNDLKKELKYIINNLNTAISQFVSESLMSKEIKETDIEGAGEYLPSVDNNFDSSLGVGEIINETKPKIIKEVKNKVKDIIGNLENEFGNSDSPDIGTITDDGSEIDIPEGHNSGTGSDPHSGDNISGFSDEGDDEVSVRSQMTGMNYRYFVVDKEQGKYVISFLSQHTEDNCELSIKYLDDSNNKYDIGIRRCIINGKEVTVSNNKIEPFSIVNGIKYKVELETDLKDMYSWEVKVYANR